MLVSMHVRVLFFGVLKDLLPGESESLELPQGATVQTLLGVYRHRLPQNDALWASLAVAVNQQYASSGEPLAENDEVALLPPVSGGSGSGDSGSGGSESSRNAGRDPSSPVHQISLTREPIDAAALLAATKQPEDGAAVVFDGVVRNHTRGRRTLFLDYEAYEEMALAQMRELAAEAGRRFEVHAITIVHRLGRLQIGETSILIVVASPHRGAAFDACRFLIDTLKKTVPIWKREHFEDGAVWRDGEPFPAEIAASGGRPPA
jgi:molybdopterin synthase catalytic subunit/molybdopterin converting factor small subunit